MGYLRAVIPFVLAGCPVVDLGDSPPNVGQCTPARGEAYFETDIWPKYLNNPTKSCVQSGCHAENGNGGVLRLTTMPPDLPGNYRKVLVDLNCSKPDDSLLLTKPTLFDPHSGGKIFAATDPLAQTFLDWFKP